MCVCERDREKDREREGWNAFENWQETRVLIVLFYWGGAGDGFDL